MSLDFHEQTDKNSLPDAQSEKNLSLQSTLDWVGMRSIELPVQIESVGQSLLVAAKVDAMVNLTNPVAKGIHMSRLYLLLQENMAGQVLSRKTLRSLLQEMLHSHLGLADAARLSFQFQGLVKRKALKSENYGWRSYPMQVEAELGPQGFRMFVAGLVSYSSTCPASAALARRLIQDQFQQDFVAKNLEYDEVHDWLGSTHGIVATPHSQRSEARIKVELKDQGNYSAFELVNLVEETLQTAVQGAVKREDEQEFARLNGSNLMFCEDAARKVQEALLKCPQVSEFTGEFLHLESLHPHNAMARIRSANCDFTVPNL